MKRKMEGRGAGTRAWSHQRKIFYCPDSGSAHKSAVKIQLSTICSDLIAMVTERWKILIRPALATRRNGMVEGSRKTRWVRQRVVTEGERIMAQPVCVWFYVLMSRITKVHECPLQALNIWMLTLMMPFLDNRFFFPVKKKYFLKCHCFHQTSLLGSRLHKDVWNKLNSKLISSRG